MGLMVISLMIGTVLHFIMKSRAEVIGWGGAIFLQVYPHFCSGSMYESPFWSYTVKVWEVLMSAFFGVDYAWVIWLLVGCAYVGWKRLRSSGFFLRRKKQTMFSSGRLRDLDV